MDEIGDIEEVDERKESLLNFSQTNAHALEFYARWDHRLMLFGWETAPEWFDSGEKEGEPVIRVLIDDCIEKQVHFLTEEQARELHGWLEKRFINVEVPVERSAAATIAAVVAANIAFLLVMSFIVVA